LSQDVQLLIFERKLVFDNDMDAVEVATNEAVRCQWCIVFAVMRMIIPSDDRSIFFHEREMDAISLKEESHQ
jgi:hypothetical protein